MDTVALLLHHVVVVARRGIDLVESEMKNLNGTRVPVTRISEKTKGFLSLCRGRRMVYLMGRMSKITFHASTRLAQFNETR